MIFVSILFRTNKPKLNAMYDRLANAWEFTTRKHHPDSTVLLLRDLPLPDTTNRSHFFTSNHEKLKLWCDIMQVTRDITIFMDADTCFLKPIDLYPVIRDDASIFITTRKHIKEAHFPFNAGVIIAKPNNESRSFFKHWVETDQKMLLDKDLHSKYRDLYNGQNQASLGYLLERNIYHTEELLCDHYNAANDVWHLVDGYTQVLHINGSLRQRIFKEYKRQNHPRAPHPKSKPYPYQHLVELWLDIEKEMKDAQKKQTKT